VRLGSGLLGSGFPHGLDAELGDLELLLKVDDHLLQHLLERPAAVLPDSTEFALDLR